MLISRGAILILSVSERRLGEITNCKQQYLMAGKNTILPSPAGHRHEAACLEWCRSLEEFDPWQGLLRGAPSVPLLDFILPDAFLGSTAL